MIVLHIGNSAVGQLFPLELFPIVGVCLLLFNDYLFHGRLWGSRASSCVANLGPNRSDYSCADVRPIRQLPLCYRYPARRARVNRETPDLVLLDRHMPELDGFATLAEFRRDPQLASIPIVALTARAM